MTSLFKTRYKKTLQKFAKLQKKNKIILTKELEPPQYKKLLFSYQRKMIKKIATFMMGLGLVASSSLAFVSADDAGKNSSTDGSVPKYDMKFGSDDSLKQAGSIGVA